MNSILVRQAVLADVDALAPLFDSYRRFYGRDSAMAAAREFLAARLELGESIVYIALEDGVPAGFAQLYPSFSSVSLARTLILNDVFVLEPARRKGIASKLIAAAIDYAGASGAVRLTLSTAATNHCAQALYQSLGWKRDQDFWVYHFAVA